jgi:hypothetical protein
MSSVTVLVMKDVINHQNAEAARSLFVLGRAFSRDIPGFATGTVIMMRDVGLDIDAGADFSEKDDLRRAADSENRTNIRNVLNDKRIPFTEHTSLVLAQPERDLDPDLYWKSIEDFLIFVKKIADARSAIPGHVLCDLFDEAKPHIMQINDFNNPTIPFESILMNYVTRQLNMAQSFAIADISAIVRSEIGLWPADRLRQGVPADFLQRQIRETQAKFTKKANELYPHVADLYSAKAREVEDTIDLIVKQSCDTAFVDACAQMLVPECLASVVKDVEAEIQMEMDRLATENVSAYGFAHTTWRFQHRAESLLTNLMMTIDQAIIERPEFSNAVDSLAAEVLESLHTWEQRKKRDLEQYQKSQREASQRQLAAKMRAEQERLKRELTAQEKKKIKETQDKMNKKMAAMRLRAARAWLTADRRDRELQETIQQQKSQMDASQRAFQAATAKFEHDTNVMRQQADQRSRDHDAAMAAIRNNLDQRMAEFRPRISRPRPICTVC